MIFSMPVCANLGEREAAKRRRFGILCLLMAVAIAVGMIAFQAPNSVRSLVWIPFFLGYLGLFQAKHQTCVLLGMQGRENQDVETVAIQDDSRRNQLKRISWRIVVQSAIMAAVCTVLVLAFHPS